MIEALPYRLSRDEVDTFRRDGFLGPLRCASPDVKALPAALHRAGVRSHGSDEPIPPPATWTVGAERHINVHDPHRTVPEVMRIAAHPSLVRPITQLLESPAVAFFQSRFRVKYPQKDNPVPWHQDVGANNGGFRADGSPVPSITVWLSVDGASAASGSLEVLPGTHTRLYGDWRAGFHSKLEEGGHIDPDALGPVPIAARAEEFYLFHSWTLHRSTANSTPLPRSGLVLRYVAPADAVQPGTEYALLGAGP